MVRVSKKSNQRGFTLVELLIVIAIIGVLSTIGIPAFKRMVQKSKKTEAKTNLGGIYTAEQSFFSEYGAYGNNLFKVGFIIDGTNNNLIYSVGFPTSGCASQGTILPGTGTTVGKAIQTAFPGYFAYTGGATQVPNGGSLYAKGSSMVYNGYSAACASGATGLTSPPGYMLKDGGTPVFGASNVYSYAPAGGTAPADPNGYFATANGVVSTGVNKASAAIALQDVWSIDHECTLMNINDGVN